MEETVTIETTTRNVHAQPQCYSTTSAANRSKRLGALAIGLAIFAAFISTISFSLDHAVPETRIHKHIFSEYSLIGAILMIIGLVFAYFNPIHKWIYYSIFCTALVFTLLCTANFIYHMCLIDQKDDYASFFSLTEGKSILKLLKSGAAFTFVDGVFKALVAAICLMIAAAKN